MCKENLMQIRKPLYVILACMLCLSFCLFCEITANAEESMKEYHVHTEQSWAVSNVSYEVHDYNIYIPENSNLYGYYYAPANFYTFVIVDDTQKEAQSGYKTIGTITYTYNDGTQSVSEKGDVDIQHYPLDRVISLSRGNALFNFNILKELLVDTDIPIFSSGEALAAYLESGDTSGQINKPPIDLEANGVLDVNLEIPRLSVDSVGYNFSFENGSNDVYFELRGRWYSVDDIELFKENLMWKYSYSTLLKNNLSTWVSANDVMSSSDSYSFSELGADSFQNLLSLYPVDERNYLGGSNALGNYFGGYNDALDTIKFLLSEETSVYNGLEVYVRYYTFRDDGQLVYSKWTHWYDALANAAGSSGSQWDDKENIFTEFESVGGLTDNELNNIETSGNSRADSDVQSSYNNFTNYYDKSDGLLNALSDFMDMLKGLVDALGDFPALISSVFSFLPSWLINLISLGIASLIILRFLGR